MPARPPASRDPDDTRWAKRESRRAGKEGRVVVDRDALALKAYQSGISEERLASLATVSYSSVVKLLSYHEPCPNRVIVSLVCRALGLPPASVIVVPSQLRARELARHIVLPREILRRARRYRRRLARGVELGSTRVYPGRHTDPGSIL